MLVEHLDGAHVGVGDGHVVALTSELPQVGAELYPGSWGDSSDFQRAIGVIPQHLVCGIDRFGSVRSEAPRGNEELGEVLPARHAGNSEGGRWDDGFGQIEELGVLGAMFGVGAGSDEAVEVVGNHTRLILLKADIAR